MRNTIPAFEMDAHSGTAPTVRGVGIIRWACVAAPGRGWGHASLVARDAEGCWRAILDQLPVEQLLTGAVQVDPAASVLLPGRLDPALATLCVPLAAALAHADTLKGRQSLRFKRYDLAAALVHADLLRRANASSLLAPRVCVPEEGPLRVSTARALGAHVEDTAPQPTIESAPASAMMAGLAEVRAAVDIVAAQPWWFQPLVTGAMTLDELRAGGPSVLAEHVGVVVAA